MAGEFREVVIRHALNPKEQAVLARRVAEQNEWRKLQGHDCPEWTEEHILVNIISMGLYKLAQDYDQDDAWAQDALRRPSAGPGPFRIVQVPEWLKRLEEEDQADELRRKGGQK